LKYHHIACLGPDALTFLQGQLTCDMRTVRPDALTLACYCNLKGRVVAAPYLYAVEQGFHLIIPDPIAPILLKALSKVGVFSQVTLTELSAELPAIPVLSHPQFPIQDDFGFTLGTAEPPACDEAWEATLIKHKIPLISLPQSEQFLPHYLGMVERGAISFTKGCYLGQEIIARMHYKGNLKKHLVSVVGDDLPNGDLVNQVIYEGKRYTLMITEKSKESQDDNT
jgi:folate-binding protein YgfZ